MMRDVMIADQTQLAHLLTVAGLLGGTIEYIEIVKRRVAARRAEAEREAGAESGLRGIVRVMLIDREARDARKNHRPN